MRVVFSELAWADYVSWQKSDRRVVGRINDLIRDIQRAPFEGIGKPERILTVWTPHLVFHWTRATLVSRWRT